MELSIPKILIALIRVWSTSLRIWQRNLHNKERLFLMNLDIFFMKNTGRLSLVKTTTTSTKINFISEALVLLGPSKVYSPWSRE